MRFFSIAVALIALCASVSPAVANASIGGGSNVSGTVTTDESGNSTLTLTGDGRDNSIAILQVNDTIIVVGLLQTKVNGNAYATFNGTNLNTLHIAMAGGNDTVYILTGLSADSSLTADGGVGGDTLHVFGTVAIGSTTNVTGFETLVPPNL